MVAFAATVTDAGAFSAGDPLFVIVTTAPPTGAACDSVAVHDVLPFEFSVVAVHPSAVMVGSEEVALTVPPLAESARPSPARDALTGLPTPIAALVKPEANTALTVATTPFGMRSVV